MADKNMIRGAIVRNGYTIGSFADALGITRYTLSKKINGKSEFRASEIEKSCALLGIAKKDVGKYFFAM